MISTRMERLQVLRFAFNLIPAAIIAALLAKFFALSFWQGLGLLLAFQIVCAVWDMIWSSVWFQLIERRTLVEEFLDSLRERHYPAPEDDHLSSPYYYFSEVRDGALYPIDLRIDAAGVASALWSAEASTIQRGMQLNAAWTKALTQYQVDFAKATIA